SAKLVSNLRTIAWRLAITQKLDGHADVSLRSPPSSDIPLVEILRHCAAFHSLPTSGFWEDLTLENQRNYLILFVGAAGFEPTTCSTQNCRATRLRYTPIFGRPRRYTLKPAPARRDAPPTALKRQSGQRYNVLTMRWNEPARRSVRCRSYLVLNKGWATRSPGWIPYFCAVPAITSSTPFASPLDGMILVDNGSVSSAIRRILPSERMKIMSSEM